MKQLASMLTYRRPHGSDSEAEFIDRFIRPTGATEDKAGNLHLRIGDAPVLWSAHTDTVHKTEGRQTLVHDDRGIIRSTAGVLGADDAVGCWLLLRMIRHGVPGLYVFHRGEERGGIGAGYIATDTPEVLADITHAVAFDRRGYGSVITHQGYRTASDEYAEALADTIGLNMAPDPTGVYTDTAEYAHLIPECTNVSVGYDNEHTARELCDPGFAGALARALCTIDAATIAAWPIERDPTDPADSGSYWKGWSGYGKETTPGADESAAWGELYAEVLDRPDAATELLFSYGLRADAVRDSADSLDGVYG